MTKRVLTAGRITTNGPAGMRRRSLRQLADFGGSSPYVVTAQVERHPKYKNWLVFGSEPALRAVGDELARVQRRLPSATIAGR